ncbi:hypothetical protein H9645_06230 [Luteimonas sp. Sa2BVA3]|uniref:Uncharacterized protein n=1 Tax=Luteimonas colneyensis TaxID=2762230 RepID=A0ABR8UHW6_9GAMM|nr:hypothetical protein [Luteimonas colneyensis]MBD7987625.1 hypothetical protein [Luteimonas colneyensis]
MKAFVIAFVVFVAVSIVTGWMQLGWLGTIAALVVAVVVYSRVSRSSSAATGSEVAAGNAGAATFSWKGIDVYQDQGFFTYRGGRYEIANVVRISYETSGNRGCLGGTHYKIHIHMNDLKMPRVTVGAGNVTHGGNDETERNYERLGIVLGCR